MNARFEVAAGSVVGRDHVAAGRNNQDAFCFWTGPEAIVAVVADGCGSGRFSEVGARLGSRLVVESVRRHLGQLGEESAGVVLDSVRLEVLDTLHALTSALGGSMSQIVADHLLFTVVGAVLTDSRSYVFTLGDGVYAVNGAVEVITSPDNEPAYLGYGLTDSARADAGPDGFRFTVRRMLATSALDTLLLGTDGVGDLIAAGERHLPKSTEAVGPLSQFWEDDRHFRNPASVGRRLHLANREFQRIDWDERRVHREHGRLPDDTTLIAIRRRPQAHGEDRQAWDEAGLA